MRPDAPLYSFERDRSYVVETRQGATHQVRDYRGWERTPEGFLHRFSAGRARVSVLDSAIRSVTQ